MTSEKLPSSALNDLLDFSKKYGIKVYHNYRPIYDTKLKTIQGFEVNPVLHFSSTNGYSDRVQSLSIVLFHKESGDVVQVEYRLVDISFVGIKQFIKELYLDAMDFAKIKSIDQESKTIFSGKHLWMYSRKIPGIRELSRIDIRTSELDFTSHEIARMPNLDYVFGISFTRDVLDNDDFLNFQKYVLNAMKIFIHFNWKMREPLVEAQEILEKLQNGQRN